MGTIGAHRTGPHSIALSTRMSTDYGIVRSCLGQRPPRCHSRSLQPLCSFAGKARYWSRHRCSFRPAAGLKYQISAKCLTWQPAQKYSCSTILSPPAARTQRSTAESAGSGAPHPPASPAGQRPRHTGRQSVSDGLRALGRPATTLALRRRGGTNASILGHMPLHPLAPRSLGGGKRLVKCVGFKPSGSVVLEALEDR